MMRVQVKGKRQLSISNLLIQRIEGQLEASAEPQIVVAILRRTEQSLVHITDKLQKISPKALAIQLISIYLEFYLDRPPHLSVLCRITGGTSAACNRTVQSGRR